MPQSGSDVKLINSRVLSNEVEGCCGGGITNQGGKLTILRTLIRGNKAMLDGGAGGGIAIQTSGLALVLKNSTVANNVSNGDGGGIAFQGNGFGEIVNSTISSNDADGDGGGILDETTSALTLRHVTLNRNEAVGPSGGIYTDGGAWAIFTSIIAGNDDDDCNAILVGPTGKNLDGDSSCFDDPAALHGNARLDPLDNNGGKTPTNEPRRSSAAVDVIGRASCPPPARDQRGVRRPQNGDGQPGKKCDLGAVERKP